MRPCSRRSPAGLPPSWTASRKKPRAPQGIWKGRRAGRVRAGWGSCSKVVEINGVKVLAAKLDASNIKAMRELMDDIRSKMPSGVACIAAPPVDEGKVSMILYVSKDLHGRFTAPALIKEVARPLPVPAADAPIRLRPAARTRRALTRRWMF